MNALWSILAGVLSGAIGAMGLGGGGVLLIYLTVFASVEQLRAQGINLLFFIPCGIVAAVIYACRKQLKWKAVALTAAGGLAGVAAGAWLANYIGAQLLSKLFAVGLILLGLKEFFSKNQSQEK